MALARDFKDTVKERAARDPAFAKAILDEAATAFLNGEPHVARLILRDLVNASIGFEDLAAEINRPSKSLHRMLSEKGNPAWTIWLRSSARSASGLAWHSRLMPSRRRETSRSRLDV